MLAHIRAEHLASIRDKFDDMCAYSPHDNLGEWVSQADRVLKALSVYILKDGLNREDYE